MVPGSVHSKNSLAPPRLKWRRRQICSNLKFDVVHARDDRTTCLARIIPCGPHSEDLRGCLLRAYV